MGRHNQQRRKMKAKARKSRSGSAPGWPADGFAAGRARGAAFAPDGPAGAFGTRPGPASEAVQAETRVRDLVARAIQAVRADQVEQVGRALTQVASRGSAQGVVLRVVAGQIKDMISAVWQGGWEPADLHRLAGRRMTSTHQDLLLDAVVEDLARYAPATVDPRWRAQLDELDAGVWWPDGQTCLTARAGASWGVAMDSAAALLHFLARVPVLERLGALPGEYTPPRGEVAKVDERILSRVRALLAKAESTTFEAEAETFTAGAQSLMARYSIDLALLAADQHDADAPAARRIGIDPPYESPKVHLLSAVAGPNRCRTVWSKELGFVTVLGFAADLDAVETLFTSLLVQSTRAMAREGKRTYAGGGSRTRSFRQSFLSSFAQRIGERLREATDEVMGQAESAAGRSGGRALVPLMAARAQEVDDATDAMFPELRTSPMRMGTDPEGWASGRRAADRAALTRGARLSRASG